MANNAPHPPCPLIKKMKEKAITEKLYDSMVIVRVGSSEKEFHVHKGLICYYSEYFRGAFKSGFQESEGVVKLDQDEVDVFQCFFNWLYTGKLLNDGEDFKISTTKDCMRLIKTYIFAEARGIPMLKNTTIDKFFDLAIQEMYFPVQHVKDVYENSTENDKLRALLVSLITRWQGIHGAIFFADTYKASRAYPYDFLVDISKAGLGKENAHKPDATTDQLKTWNKCDFHDHTDINAPREPKTLTPKSSGNSSTPKE